MKPTRRTDIAGEEARFHDVWANSIKVEELDIYTAFSAPTTPEYRYALSLLGDLSGKQLLDLGCGAGESSAYFAAKEAKVTAVDISGKMLELAQKLARLWRLGEQVQPAQMNAEILAFPDATFDLIFGNSVLHHIDLKDAGSEIARVLKPGGKAVFLEPLAYNPIIEVYRRMARGVRTPAEHPLVYDDLVILRRHFAVSHENFQFCTLAIFLWFFIGQRVLPNQERYWKKIVHEGEHYRTAFERLYAMDRLLFRWLPFLKRFCWVIVIDCQK
jgi:SAM-dependent methyltransferase